MDRFEGMATVYTYESAGGIALFSTEPPEGAISGGSGGGEGSQTQATRIRWWIIQNNDGTYSGGVTGEGWFQNISYYGQPLDGPFDGIDVSKIYEYALDGNLDEVFLPWNSEHSGSEDTTIQRFVMYLKENGAGGCVIEGGLGS